MLILLETCTHYGTFLHEMSRTAGASLQDVRVRALLYRAR